jgi:5-methylcytosine-specific restriction endonuclease McrA
MAAIRVYYRPWLIGLGQGAGVSSARWRPAGIAADFIRTMSQQRFSDVERRALWEAHRKRCLYCASPLLFKELFIDHVIPEKLKDDPVLDSVRISHCLPPGFELEGDENLAPSCHSCNIDKLDRLLTAERAALILTRVQEKLPEVRDLRTRYADASGADKAILGILTALGSGNISWEEITNAIRDHESGQDTFRVYRDLEFIEGAPISLIKRSDISRLLDMTVKLGTELPEGLELVKDDGQTRYVRTTREYRAATAEGFFPPNNFAFKMAGFFVLPSAVLSAIEKAQPALNSFIRDPRVGVSDLRYVPSSLLPYLVSQPELDCATLEDVLAKGRLTIRSTTSYSVEFEYSGMIRLLVEVMRADLNGDGVEDILVWSYQGVIEGTHSLVSTMVLSRPSPEALFEQRPL